MTHLLSWKSEEGGHSLCPTSVEIACEPQVGSRAEPRRMIVIQEVVGLRVVRQVRPRLWQA